MERFREWRAAAAVVSAAGFLSGRQFIFYFAQTGGASWLGVVAASAAFGFLCAMMCRFAKDTGAKSVAGTFIRLLEPGRGRVIGILHAALMAATAAYEALETGRLAMLSLPLHNAFWMGVLFSLGIALLMCMRRMRGLMCAGWVVWVLTALFLLALAADPREIRVYGSFEAEAELSGSVPVALMLAVMYAALKAAITAGVTVSAADSVDSALRFGIFAGGMMLFQLCAANAAVLRAGERIFAQSYPIAVLAARWRKVGFYASILAMWTGAVMTMTAALGVLAGSENHDKTAC